MALWASTIKTTSCANFTLHPAPLGLAPRTLPPPLTAIQYGRLELAKSIARCNALYQAPPSLLRRLAVGSLSLLEFLVDDPPPGFELLARATALADVELNKFAHDLGVGLADLYMERIGFAWRDNGKSVLPKGGSFPDFIYDDGSGVGGVVAVEAKGSATPNATSGAIDGTARQGYLGQVHPNLGSHCFGSSFAIPTPIDAGFAIGAAAPAGGGPAALAVHQTTFPAHATGLAKAGTVPHTDVALGNYRAVFALAGANELVAAIDDLRQGVAHELALTAGRLWRLAATHRGRRIYTHPGGDTIAAFLGIRFAIDGDVLDRLFAFLTPRPRVGTFMVLPDLPLEALASSDDDGAIVLSRDGFCAMLSDVADPRGAPFERTVGFGKGSELEFTPEISADDDRLATV